MKQLEESTGEILQDIGLGSYFGEDHKSTNKKSNNTQMRLYKTKKLLTAKERINSLKRQPENKGRNHCKLSTWQETNIQNIQETQFNNNNNDNLILKG